MIFVRALDSASIHPTFGSNALLTAINARVSSSIGRGSRRVTYNLPGYSLKRNACVFP